MMQPQLKNVVAELCRTIAEFSGQHAAPEFRPKLMSRSTPDRPSIANPIVPGAEPTTLRNEPVPQ